MNRIEGVIPVEDFVQVIIKHLLITSGLTVVLSDLCQIDFFVHRKIGATRQIAGEFVGSRKAASCWGRRGKAFALSEDITRRVMRGRLFQTFLPDFARTAERSSGAQEGDDFTVIEFVLNYGVRWE